MKTLVKQTLLYFSTHVKGNDCLLSYFLNTNTKTNYPFLQEMKTTPPMIHCLKV